MNLRIHDVKASQTNGAALEVRNMIPSKFGFELFLSAKQSCGVSPC